MTRLTRLSRLNIILGIVVISGAVVICILWGLVAWYFIQPMLQPAAEVTAVNEGLPLDIPSSAELETMSPEERAQLEADLMAAAANQPDTEMADPLPEEMTEEPVIVAQGQFQAVDASHQGTGTATLYQLPDGSHLLRFENFRVTNGPDLHVILTTHPAPTSHEELMTDFLDLGSLKGNAGEQNYTIPGGLTVSPFKNVVIYCRPFQVIFALAELETG